jgi:TonB-dependent receptor
MSFSILSLRASTVATVSLSALAFASAAPAFSQVVEENSEDIVVTGSIVAAQEASIEAKRDAVNVADIVSADAAGRFPDQNSAAVLARLPAVAVQRDQGQERYIQVRGAPNRWSSVSFDGVPLIGVDEGGETRAFRFDAVPAVLLSSLAVNKSLTADLTAEAVVANIDLRSYSPLENRGFHVQGDIGYGFMELGNGEQRQASLRLSWANENVGFVLGGSHYRREQITDNREVGLYDDPSDAADTQFGPTEIDIRTYSLTRESNGLFAGVEWEPVAGQRLFARAVYTQFYDNELRNQYELRLANTTLGSRNLTGGDLVRVPVRGTFNDGEYDTRYYIGTIGGDMSEEGWTGRVRLNYTRSENTTNLPLIQFNNAQTPSLNYDFSDPRFPIVQLFQTVPGATTGAFVRGPALTGIDQLNVASAVFIPVLQDTFTDSYTIMFDVEREIGPWTFSTGMVYADREIEGFTFAASNAVVLTTALPGIGRTFTPGSYVTSTPWVTNFPLGFSLNYIDNRRLRRDVEDGIAALTAAGRFNPANNVPAANRYAIGERLFATYVQGQYEFEGGLITAGARIENFRIDNSGTASLGGGRFANLSVPQDYTDIYPSVNARFDLSDDLILRLAGQRSVARPSFGQIRVGAAINDTASPGTIGGGNPGLQPEYTWGVDASLEYYLPGRGILSVAGFHRWVDNVLYGNTETVGSDIFNSDGIDRSGYRLSSTFNGNSGRLYGIEFNYQQQFTFLPSPLDGFGFQGNLTFLGGEFDTDIQQGIDFPGTSDTIVNASLYYEKYGFSVRLSYQWRSDWLDTLGGLGTGGTGDEVRQGYENLDLSVRYAVTDNFTLFADLNNLTDALYIAYQGTPDRPSEVEQIGGRYLFGIRFSI